MQISATLDTIDATHAVLCDISPDVVGTISAYTIHIVERLETQDSSKCEVIYRFFADIADPPDGNECTPTVREVLWARMRITPREKHSPLQIHGPNPATTVADQSPVVSQNDQNLPPRWTQGEVGEEHIRAICAAVDVLPSCTSLAAETDAERTLINACDLTLRRYRH
ncbi:DUF222 domain-containing protein [Mycobacterium leprae]|uniref:DUF222 domain-containing protein n=1 Tax=Mycobacterium leprae TaxID=1769 RepID=O32896_MYCLR|nr:DUF222 domain-containing protein [Mycobacterium leprae]OAR21687.1 hypothetical protein A8144_00265 [Mycobacterium leprae 3125609]OAX72225.1 hypothetical protein A3216_00325 [Mycobacterium leprae 7935681]CAB11017.1 hypothetical protein MLCB1779.36 [Mycobacterium leprae]